MGKKSGSQKGVVLPKVPVSRVTDDFKMPVGNIVEHGETIYYNVPWEKAIVIPEADRNHRFRDRNIVDVHAIILGKGNIPEMVGAQQSMGIKRAVIMVASDRCLLEVGDMDRGDEPLAVAMEAFRRYPERFEVFCNIDFRGFTDARWTDRELRRFDQLWAKGVKGIKGLIGQSVVIRGWNALLGLPKHHSFLTDPKLQPLWRHAGELGAVVFEHVGDALMHDQYYPIKKAYAEFEETVAAHPGTTFVAPHLFCSVDNMEHVTAWLRKYPNLYTTISGPITVLGPTTAFTAEGAAQFREFLIEYDDKIIFGSDTGLGDQQNIEAMLYLYRRWLEDPFGSYFEMGHEKPWRIYGLGLPEETLEKLYHGNLERLLSQQQR